MAIDKFKIKSEVVAILKSGGIGVLPTDTLYGIVGSALREDTVCKIYAVRRRNPKKPMIILIGNVSDLKKFNIFISAKMKKWLKKVWPGAVSVILPLPRRTSIQKKFLYLHRGTGALAFRLPQPPELRKLLRQTGPLTAPSANFEGQSPAMTIREAKKYFGDTVDFYINAGCRSGKASTLVQISHGNIVILRKGAVEIFPAC